MVTREEVASKKMASQADRADLHLQLQTELTALNELNHPNIIKLLGIVVESLTAILELAPLGSLRSVYTEYYRADQLIHTKVIHKTLIDVSLSIVTTSLM